MTVKVLVQPSGHEFEVEGDETILDAALRHGFAFPYGCRSGLCGSCRGKVLAGEITYPEGVPEKLSDEERAAGEAFFCKAVPVSDVTVEVREISAAKEIEVRTLPCRVAKLERLNHDVMLVMLKLPATDRMQFLAGQYVDFLLPGGKRRSFSLANAPHNDELLELHIRHIDGGRFTSEVFDKWKVRDIVRIEGPLGSFYLRDESDKPIIMLAGGTGFAPLKGMVEHSIERGSERPIHLYWGVRAREDLYMHELAEEWARTLPNFRYTPVLSEPKPEDEWWGRTGYVHEVVMADYADLSGYEVYASGPPAMVYAGRDAFVTRGLASDDYYSDAFEFAND
ncbi:MAG TPA: CDP-6-deoxy-delta-3,4-glucoseen reductase [Gammaproteobacteria bacterium]|nr:CDP-6-deoxy-delta-3,4-glucoseen reductase [Gammaproteobacteria bacterium]